MSKNTKIILGVVAGLVVLCGIACVVAGLGLGLFGTLFARQVSSGVSEDPQQVLAKQQEIADFDLPAGYEPKTSLNLLGIKMVVYTGSSTDSYLVLMQMPTNMELNETTIEQFQRQMETQSGRQLRNLHTVTSKDLTIRGKPGQEIIQEGTDNNGNVFRQGLVIFEGKGGTAMLAAGGPGDTFNQAEFEKMIGSIR